MQQESLTRVLRRVSHVEASLDARSSSSTRAGWKLQPFDNVARGAGAVAQVDGCLVSPTARVALPTPGAGDQMSMPSACNDAAAD